MRINEISYNLAGVVRNMALPVAGTTILLYDYWATGSGLVRHYLSEQSTGPKGEFNFDVRKGIYCLEIIPNKETRFARQSIEAIKVIRNTSFTIGLKTGSVLSGKVRTADGTVVTDGEVVLYGVEPHVIRASEEIKRDGSYSIALESGMYLIACRHKTSEPDDEDELVAVPHLVPSLNVMEIEGDQRHDLVFPQLMRFSGLVNNDEGHPLPEVKVTVKVANQPQSSIENEEELIAVCITDNAGQFACDVEAGTYDVRLQPEPDSHLSERMFSAILVDQSRSRTYSLGPGYRLSGQVTFDNKPVQHALVNVFGGKIESSILTDAKGRYSFSLSGGTYELQVSPQPDSLARMPFRAIANFASTITLAEDTRKNIVLEKGVAISGRVADHDGRARQAVPLSLYRDTGTVLSDNNRLPRPVAYGITGDDGSFEFRVNQGKYLLVMNGQKSTAQSIDASEQDSHNELSWQGACVVNLEIHSQRDEPVPNCRVYCRPYSTVCDPLSGEASEEQTAAISADDGRCEIVLNAGIYSFTIEPPDIGSFEAKHIRQLSVNCDLHKKIKLALKE